MKKKKQAIKLKSVFPIRWIILGTVIIILILVSLITKKYSLQYKNFFSDNIPLPTSSIAATQLNINILSPNMTTVSKEEYINLAIEDLARKLDIDKKIIQTVKIEEKQWADTSLGCPQSGKMYAQMISPGYLIELSAMGKSFLYHAGSNRVISCKSQ